MLSDCLLTQAQGELRQPWTTITAWFTRGFTLWVIHNWLLFSYLRLSTWKSTCLHFCNSVWGLALLAVVYYYLSFPCKICLSAPLFFFPCTTNHPTHTYTTHRAVLRTHTGYGLDDQTGTSNTFLHTHTPTCTHRCLTNKTVWHVRAAFADQWGFLTDVRRNPTVI